MTPATQQPVILQSAFTAPIGHWQHVIRFPSGTPLPPPAARGSVAGGRAVPPPLAVRLSDVRPAQTADSLVTLPDVLPDVARVAADPPLVHTGVAAERAPRRPHRRFAPAADRLTERIAIGDAPLVRRDGATTHQTHELFDISVKTRWRTRYNSSIP